jgi:hypothetical protein
VANEVVLAKRKGQGYEAWLRARMPDDHHNEFVAKCRANRLWHEVGEEQAAGGALRHRYTTEDNEIDPGLVAARVAAVVAAAETAR